MVITEATVISWLSANFPSVAIGLIAASIFIVIYLRLRTFLDRMDNAETELIKVRKEMYRIKMKVSQMVLMHCKLHKEDMEALMKIEPEERDE